MLSVEGRGSKVVSYIPMLVVIPVILQFCCTTSENAGSSEELEMYEGPVPRGGCVLWVGLFLL